MINLSFAGPFRRALTVRLWRLASLFSVLFVTAGCTAVKPKPAINHIESWNIPNHWSASSISEPQDRFEVSLQNLLNQNAIATLVDEALAANADLKQVALELKSTQQLLVIAESNRWPSLAFKLDRTRSGSHNRLEGFRSREITQNYEYGLSASWEVDLWGKLADMSEAEQQQWRASAASYGQLRNAIARQVIRLGIQTGLLSRRAQVEAKHLKALKQTEDVVRESFRLGINGLEDLSDVLVQIKTTQAKNEVTLEQKRQAQRSLRTLLGRLPNVEEERTSNRLLAEITPGVIPTIDYPPISTPANMIAKRLDIQAAFSRVKSLDLKTNAAVKALLPQITLSASGGKSARKWIDLVNGNTAWTLVGGLTQPVFQRGRLLAEIRAQSLQAESAWWHYKKVVLAAMEEVENAMAMEQSLSRQHALLLAAAQASDKSMESYEQRYRLGSVNIIELINVRIGRLAIDERLIEANAALMENRVTLAFALGLGVNKV